MEALLLLELCSKRLFWSEVESFLGLEKIDWRPTFSIIRRTMMRISFRAETMTLLLCRHTSAVRTDSQWIWPLSSMRFQFRFFYRMLNFCGSFQLLTLGSSSAKQAKSLGIITSRFSFWAVPRYFRLAWAFRDLPLKACSRSRQTAVTFQTKEIAVRVLWAGKESELAVLLLWCPARAVVTGDVVLQLATAFIYILQLSFTLCFRIHDTDFS